MGDLRLKKMQDKLNEQQKCIEERENKIKLLSKDLEETSKRNDAMKTTIEKHTNLPGFDVYLWFTNTVAFLVSRINIFTSWISLLCNIFIQVLMMVACKVPSYMCMEATWLFKEIAGRYTIVNQQLIDNFKNEYLEKCSENSENITRRTLRKKKYYKN